MSADRIEAEIRDLEPGEIRVVAGATGTREISLGARVREFRIPEQERRYTAADFVIVDLTHQVWRIVQVLESNDGEDLHFICVPWPVTEDVPPAVDDLDFADKSVQLHSIGYYSESTDALGHGLAEEVEPGSFLISIDPEIVPDVAIVNLEYDVEEGSTVTLEKEFVGAESDPTRISTFRRSDVYTLNYTVTVTDSVGTSYEYPLAVKLGDPVVHYLSGISIGGIPFARSFWDEQDPVPQASITLQAIVGQQILFRCIPAPGWFVEAESMEFPDGVSSIRGFAEQNLLQVVSFDNVTYNIRKDANLRDTHFVMRVHKSWDIALRIIHNQPVPASPQDHAVTVALFTVVAEMTGGPYDGYTKRFSPDIGPVVDARNGVKHHLPANVDLGAGVRFYHARYRVDLRPYTNVLAAAGEHTINLRIYLVPIDSRIAQTQRAGGGTRVWVPASAGDADNYWEGHALHIGDLHRMHAQSGFGTQIFDYLLEVQT